MGYFQRTWHAEHVRIYNKPSSRRLRQWLARKILPRTKQLHVWAAIQMINEADTAWLGDDPHVNVAILPEHMMWTAKAVMESELDQVIVTGRLAAFNQITEEEIIHQRLARRYDPGMAMNEAFQRAGEKVEKIKPHQFVPVRPGETMAEAQQRVVAARSGVEPGPIPEGMSSLELSPTQKAALSVQQEFLRKNAAQAPRPSGE